MERVDEIDVTLLVDAVDFDKAERQQHGGGLGMVGQIHGRARVGTRTLGNPQNASGRAHVAQNLRLPVRRQPAVREIEKDIGFGITDGKSHRAQSAEIFPDALQIVDTKFALDLISALEMIAGVDEHSLRRKF